MVSTLLHSPEPESRVWYRHARLVLCALAALTLGGCGQPEGVTDYDTPKPDTKETPGKNRLLAAIFLCNDDMAWHFKLVGPMQQMTEHEREFLDFLQTIRFDKKGQPTWDVPQEWSRLPNRQGRFAAFQIGSGKTALELTVVPLPAEKGDINLLPNVNRWRRLMHRQGIDESTLEQFKRTIVVDGKQVPLVDLTGSGSGKTPRDPDEPEVIEATPSSLTKYDTPPGWVETKEQDPEAAKVGVKRAAAFNVSDGNLTALVTVIPMPNTGLGAIRANLDRWAKQIGLAPLNEKELKDRLNPIIVDGIDKCFLIDLVGRADSGREEILAAVVVLNDKLWTFKMKGPAELVTRQKAAFESFVMSAKFEGGR